MPAVQRFQGVGGSNYGVPTLGMRYFGPKTVVPTVEETIWRSEPPSRHFPRGLSALRVQAQQRKTKIFPCLPTRVEFS